MEAIKPKVKIREISVPLEVTKVSITPLKTQVKAVKPITEVKTKLAVEQVTKATSQVSVEFGATFAPKVRGITLSELSFEFHEKPRKPSTRKKGAIAKPKYKPSLIAISLGIKGKKPKRLTGLEIRPLL